MWVHLHEKLISKPDAALAARRRLGGVLQELGWSQCGRIDLMLAVSEAVTNSYQHAYSRSRPGPIYLQAHTLTGPNGTRRFCVTVSDHGNWLASGPRRRRGGLAIMRATTAHMTIHSDALGTRVTMMSAPDPPVGHPEQT